MQSEKVPISALPQLLGTKSAQKKNMQRTAKYNQLCVCDGNTGEKKEVEMKHLKKTNMNT